MTQKAFSKTPNQKLRFGTGRVWLLAVAAVVIAGVLVWWQWQKPVEEPAPGEGQPPAEVEQPPADETANWKTYRNEEYGFEFRYPKDWTKEEMCSEGVCRGWRVGDPVDKDTFLDIAVYHISPRSFEEYISEVIERYFHQTGIPASMKDRLVSKKELTIDGIKAIERVVEYASEPRTDLLPYWSGNEIVKLYIPIKDEWLLQFDVPSVIKDIFNQILSTFRFLE